MFDKSEFSKRLKERRRAVGYATQDMLATAAGISMQAVSAYEKGDRVPSGEMVAALAAALECSTDYLLLLEDTPTHDTTDICGVTGLSADAVDVLCSYAAKDCPIPYGDILCSFLNVLIKREEAIQVAVFFDSWRYAVAKNVAASSKKTEIEKVFSEWMCGERKEKMDLQSAADLAFAIDDAATFEDAERYRLVRAFERFLDAVRE